MQNCSNYVNDRKGDFAAAKRDSGIHLESFFGISETDVPFLPSGPLLFSCLPGMPGILVAGSL